MFSLKRAVRARIPEKTSLRALLATSLGAMLLGVSVPALAANQSCAECLNRLPPGLGPLAGLPAEDNLLEMRNVAWMMSPGSRLRGGILSRTQEELDALKTDPVTGKEVWNGVGELPNAFQRPWEMPKTDLDPTFVTSYYNERDGVLNVASAPWNQILGPTYGGAFYQLAHGNPPPFPRGQLFFPTQKQ